MVLSTEETVMLKKIEMNVNGESIDVTVIPFPVPNAAVVEVNGEQHYFVTSALARFPKEEVDAVMLHELGHVECGHLTTMIEEKQEWVSKYVADIVALKCEGASLSLMTGIMKRTIQFFSSMPAMRKEAFEIEADLYAVEEGGKAIRSALERLYRRGWFLMGRKGRKELKKRIAILEERELQEDKALI